MKASEDYHSKPNLDPKDAARIRRRIMQDVRRIFNGRDKAFTVVPYTHIGQTPFFSILVPREAADTSLSRKLSAYVRDLEIATAYICYLD